MELYSVVDSEKPSTVIFIFIFIFCGIVNTMANASLHFWSVYEQDLYNFLVKVTPDKTKLELHTKTIHFIVLDYATVTFGLKVIRICLGFSSLIYTLA